MDTKYLFTPTSSGTLSHAGVIQSESRRLRAESIRLRAELRATIEQVRRERLSGAVRPDVTTGS